MGPICTGLRVNTIESVSYRVNVESHWFSPSFVSFLGVCVIFCFWGFGVSVSGLSFLQGLEFSGLFVCG